jgi:hypothetical protein
MNQPESNSYGKELQDREERDLAISCMSPELREWLTYHSPVVFHAKACLDMEARYGTLMTLHLLREMIKEQTVNLYGPTYPLIGGVHFEKDTNYIDPHQTNVWANF